MKLTNAQARAAYIQGSKVFFCEDGYDRIGFRRHGDQDSDTSAGHWFDYLVKRFRHHMTDPLSITFEVD